MQGVGNKELCWMGTEFEFGKMKNILEMDIGDAAQNNVLNATELNS